MYIFAFDLIILFGTICQIFSLEGGVTLHKKNMRSNQYSCGTGLIDMLCIAIYLYRQSL